MERIQIYIPGIDTWPGCSKNWSGRAVTYTHCNSEYKAEKVEYFCGPIGRAFGQKGRAAKLYKTLSFYYRYRVRVLVGHSNGTDVILTMMRDFPAFPRVDALHLVCGATDADFVTNGLNRLLANNRVGQVFVYVAGQDMALRVAHTWLGKVLGYGVLGLHGPLNIGAGLESRVATINTSPWDSYGHSGCWGDSQFRNTMTNFLKP